RPGAREDRPSHSRGDRKRRLVRRRDRVGIRARLRPPGGYRFPLTFYGRITSCAFRGESRSEYRPARRVTATPCASYTCTLRERGVRASLANGVRFCLSAFHWRRVARVSE